PEGHVRAHPGRPVGRDAARRAPGRRRRRVVDHGHPERRRALRGGGLRHPLAARRGDRREALVPQGPRMILRGATLIDGTGAPPLRDRAVVLDDRRIAAVVPDHQARDGAALDLGGLTLLPGLINCHVHLCLSGDADPSRTLSDETYAATVVGAVVHARRTVEAGVTTVRDLGGREYAEIAVRDGVRAGIIAGPRVLCAGRAVCMTGGHGWRMLGRQADGVDDVRKAVREELRAGADVIKLVATLIAPHAIVEGGLAAGIPEFAVKKSSALRERHLESFRLALRAGVAIAAGTDAGTPLNPHGTIVPELALMAAAGLEPLQAI